MQPMSYYRDLTLCTARSILNEKGLEPTIENAEKAVDDYARTHPNSGTAYWWKNASDNQWKLFKTEWRQDIKKYGNFFK